MPRIYVPTSMKNEAMKMAATIAGLATPAVAIKLAKHHHDQLVKSLKEKGHPHVVREDHEGAPPNHELLSHTG